MKSGPGRPPKGEEALSFKIQFRVSAATYRAIEERIPKGSRVKVSEWCRTLVESLTKPLPRRKG